jgi:hypothetical protein
MIGRCGRSDRTRLARPVSSNRRQRRSRTSASGPSRNQSVRSRTRGQRVSQCRSDAVARPITSDRTRPIARGALWTPIGRRVLRVRSIGEARPVTTTALSDSHCYCLSYSDWTRPVTLISASGHHVFH